MFLEKEKMLLSKSERYEKKIHHHSIEVVGLNSGLNKEGLKKELLCFKCFILFRKRREEYSNNKHVTNQTSLLMKHV